MNETNRHAVMLDRAAEALKETSFEPVFIGGATISLHLDDPAAPEIRSTQDVDCVVSIASYAEYTEVEEELRDTDLSQSVMDEGPKCRWHADDLMLDVLPSSPDVIGFSESRWFEEGLEHAVEHELPSGRTIRTFDVPHTIAAKLEAYDDRADGDYFSSKDLEDVVMLLNGRTTVFDELAADRDVCEFIRDWFRGFDERTLRRALRGHLHESDRAPIILDKLDDMLDD